MFVLNLTVSAVYLRRSPRVYGALPHERKIYVDPLPPKFEEAPEPLHEHRPFRHYHAGPWLPPRAGAGCAPQRPTNTLVWIDTFVQWIRRRASANLALNSRSL